MSNLFVLVFGFFFWAITWVIYFIVLALEEVFKTIFYWIKKPLLFLLKLLMPAAIKNHNKFIK